MHVPGQVYKHLNMSSELQPHTPARIIRMHHNQGTQKRIPETIAIPSNGRIDVIRVKDILYLRSENNYTHIHTATGDHLIASITLGLFEDQLSGAGFLRVHNQYLVNRNFISSYLHTKSNLTLVEEHMIHVSRNKKQMLMDYFRTLVIQA